jgi:hypothetical protein
MKMADGERDGGEERPHTSVQKGTSGTSPRRQQKRRRIATDPWRIKEESPIAGVWA